MPPISIYPDILELPYLFMYVVVTYDPKEWNNKTILMEGAILFIISLNYSLHF